MEVEIDIYKPTFQWSLSWIDKALVLSWCANTSIYNILWMRMITIKFRFPPIRIVTWFMNKNGDQCYQKVGNNDG